jgi:PAS domain S-box-containing protein
MGSHLFGAGAQLLPLGLPSGSCRLTSGSDCASQQYTGHCVRKLCLKWALRTFVVALLTVSVLLPAAGQVKPIRRVLILNELGPDSPAINLIDGEIRARLERSPYQIELYTESLETTLFPDPAIQKEFFDSYIHKYRDRKPDVIIAVGPSPVHFLVQSHEKFFTDTPVVFCVTTPEMVGNPTLDSSFTGVWEMPDFTKTLEVALNLLPGTRHIVVVGGVSPYDRANEAIIKDGLRGYETRFDVTYLTDLDMPTLLERLMRLPKDSIILQAGISEDAAGTRYIIATQSNPMVAQAANAPVFPAGDMADVDVGQGAIGGYLTSFAKEGEIAAEDAERILNGDKANDIPIVRGASAYIFDLRALKRWGLKEADVPPGSIVLYRQLTLWQAYRWYIIAAIALIVLQMLLIFGLIWQRSRLREAEAEQLLVYSNVADCIFYVAVESNDRYRFVSVNPAFLKATGLAEDQVVGKLVQEVIPEPSRTMVLRTYKEAIGNKKTVRWEETSEYPAGRKVGEVTVAPVFDEAGLCTHLVGTVHDLTERRLAEEALAGMSRKLLESQEQERARIGRELHDDINQRLALLSVEIQRMKETNPITYGELRSQMGELGKRTSEISDVVQSLSHELHSSRLEYLGLVSAMKGFCKEFGDKHKVKIDFGSEGMLPTLPPDVSLCLFRVMQEGLQNARKHSGVKVFEVKLHGSPMEIRLAIRDSGVGFDPESIKDTQGLGLISMQERVRLVKGTISIKSRPQSGTEIDVRAPLSAGADQAKLAGT